MSQEPTLTEQRNARRVLNLARYRAAVEWSQAEGRGEMVFDEFSDEILCDEFSDEFLVYTEEEARAACEERIEDTLWSVNPYILAEKTGCGSTVFRALASLYEIANGPIRTIIDDTCGWKDFVDATLSGGQRGHILRASDGVEMQHTDENGRLWFFYRIN